MPAPPEIPRGARRARSQSVNYSFWVVGNKRTPFRDAYHSYLRLPWWASIGLIFIALFLANLVFAAVYFQIGGVEGVKTGSFFDALSFSVQTMATIGYGVMNPESPSAQTTMIVESLVGIIIVALATGLVFAKFSQAAGRMRFSRYAVITNHEGKQTLMFRCGNERSNVIVEATLHVIASFATVTAEGRSFYKMIDVPLVRDRMAGLRRGWTVMHVIDEKSPFYGMDSAALAKADCELEITLMGFDDVTMQTVHTMHIYTDQDIRFGHRLVDSMRLLPNGDVLLDLTKFDVIEPDGIPRDSVAA